MEEKQNIGRILLSIVIMLIIIGVFVVLYLSITGLILVAFLAVAFGKIVTLSWAIATVLLGTALIALVTNFIRLTISFGKDNNNEVHIRLEDLEKNEQRME